MLFGLSSGAALATVVGVLIEVPVMLMLVKKPQGWFAFRRRMSRSSGCRFQRGQSPPPHAQRSRMPSAASSQSCSRSGSRWQSGREATALWSEYVSRYHPLGCKRTIGCTLRYFVSSERGRLGCLLMGNAAVALAVRDKWIGWSRQERLAHLPWVVNNQRLLLFPWVRVPHLVSHVLGQLARRVQGDWEARWKYRPVLMETFVDPAHYRGVGYRAAGWLLLGESTGEGIRRGQHTYQTTPKMIFVRPLVPDFRVQLTSAEAMATRCERIEPE